MRNGAVVTYIKVQKAHLLGRTEGNHGAPLSGLSRL